MCEGDGEAHDLGKGDAVTFDADLPHHFENPGEERAVLLAVVASMYAVYHGPEGLRSIATRTHRYAAVLAQALSDGGVVVENDQFFDTLTVSVPGRAADVVSAARTYGLQLRLIDEDRVGISTSPIHQDSRRSTCTERKIVPPDPC